MKDAGKERTYRDLFEWVEELSNRGVGEIIVTSVDKDGTGRGFDEKMIKEVCRRCDIPVIASGGAGSLSHILDLIQNTEIDAVSVGSILHYSNVNSKRRKFEEKPKHFDPITITDLKSVLKEKRYIAEVISSMNKIVIIDYGLANLHSIFNAIQYLGIKPKISDSPKDIDNAEKIILPGVGAFGQAISNLNESKCANALRKAVKANKPILGICLGMHLFLKKVKNLQA